MRRVAVLAAAAAVAGCGQAKPGDVSLTVSSPSDQAVLRAGSVDVAGRVAPAGATVRVRGRRVQVRGGRFEARVPLEPGTNLVDVMGSAKDARPAMLALRVQRQVTVQVPDLLGFGPADAQDALAALGLRADVQKNEGFLERLLPVDARVCEAIPPSGTTVQPGTTVTLKVSKTC